MLKLEKACAPNSYESLLKSLSENSPITGSYKTAICHKNNSNTNHVCVLNFLTKYWEDEQFRNYIYGTLENIPKTSDEKKNQNLETLHDFEDYSEDSGDEPPLDYCVITLFPGTPNENNNLIIEWPDYLIRRATTEQIEAEDCYDSCVE